VRTRIAAATALVLANAASFAEPPLHNDAVVRIRSGSIEGGWHTGRLQRDAQQCWMVKLDRATQDHYTMVSLLAVDQLEINADGAWSAVGVRSTLQSLPAVCREYGAD